MLPSISSLLKYKVGSLPQVKFVMKTGYKCILTPTIVVGSYLSGKAKCLASMFTQIMASWWPPLCMCVCMYVRMYVCMHVCKLATVAVATIMMVLNDYKYRIARNFHRTLFLEISETSGIFRKFFYEMVL